MTAANLMFLFEAPANDYLARFRVRRRKVFL